MNLRPSLRCVAEMAPVARSTGQACPPGRKAAFCLAASVFQTVCIVDRLKDAGFLNTETSLLFVDKMDARDFAFFSAGTKTPEGVTGAMLSGVAGWLPDVHSFVFPGLGPVVAAGPISTALISAVVGGIPGALVGVGIPEYEARRYEAKIKQGGILISVRVEGASQARVAENIFKEEDAQDIASSSEILASKRCSVSHQVISQLSPTNLQPAFVASSESL